MRHRRWRQRLGAVAVSGLSAAVIAAPAMPAASAATNPAARVPGPGLKVEAAQRAITVSSFRGRVFVDPGVWVSATRSPLQFDVQRPIDSSKMSITQILRPPFGGTVRRALP